MCTILTVKSLQNQVLALRDVEAVRNTEGLRQQHPQELLKMTELTPIVIPLMLV